MASGKGLMERLRRALRTAFFMVTMVVSLVLFSATVAVSVADVLVPSSLVSVFAGRNLRSQFERYGFRHSLVDVPIISVARSVIITCVYSLCNAPGLSHGPYLGTATVCSLSSILVLSVKACVFRGIPDFEPDQTSGAFVVQRKLHLKQSWGLPVLFMSSVVFALGHIVVAYRTSCRARRKLLLHRIDQEAVFGFPGYLKVPRSPTPMSGKSFKCETEPRRRTATATAAAATAREEGYLPIRLLSDVDSLFIVYQNILLHYKLRHPDSPVSPSLVCSAFSEHNPVVSSSHLMPGRLKLDRPIVSVPSDSFHLHRSFSNAFDSDSLYAPLLTGCPTGNPFADEIPALKLDDHTKELSFPSDKKEDVRGAENGVCGIVLVHGFGGGVFSWRHVMGPLARQTGCVVSAFDRPGWGLTSRPRRGEWEANKLPNPYQLESQVDLLLDFCLAMGFSSVVLVGHDDGGLIALKAVERVRTCSKLMQGLQPNITLDDVAIVGRSLASIHVLFFPLSQVDIRGVVLLGVNLSREVIPAFARILLHTSLGKKHMVRPLLRAEITQVVNRQAWYDSRKLSPEVMSLYKAPLCVEGWDEALHEIGKLSTSSTLSPQNASVLLQAVGDVPVLVVAGAEDALVPLKSSQHLASKLVNSRLVAVSGCGHLPHEECPKALLAALSPFISRLLPDHSEGGTVRQVR